MNVVSQMPLKATERDVYEFFSKAGKVGATSSLTLLKVPKMIGIVYNYSAFSY